MQNLPCVEPILILILFSLNTASSADQTVKTCFWGTPDQNECLKLMLQSSLLTLKASGFSYFNEPFHVKDFEFFYGKLPAVGTIHVRNLQAFGLTNQTIQSVRATKKSDCQMNLEIDTVYHDLKLQLEFTGEGRFFRIRLPSTRGSAQAHFIDMESTTYVEAIEEFRNNEKFLKVTAVDVSTNPKWLSYDAVGVSRSKIINDKVVGYVRRHYRRMMPKVLSATKTTWEPIAISLFNRMLSHYPYTAIIKDE